MRSFCNFIRIVIEKYCIVRYNVTIVKKEGNVYDNTV